MIRAIVLFLLATFSGSTQTPATSSAAAAPPADDEIAHHAARLLEGYDDTGLFSGAVLVARGDRVLFQATAGLANAEFQVPNTIDTRFRIVGISQLLTAAAVLRLQEQGKLHVTDAAGKYMTGWPDAYKPLTIHQLLISDTGVTNVTRIPEFVRSVAVPRGTQELAALILKELPAQAAATPGRFNNSDYHLLAAIVERVGHLGFTEHIRREIILPLGLTQTSHDDPSAIIERRASGFASGPELKHASWFHMDNAVGMASLISTVGDIHRFIVALTTGKLLSSKSLEQMTTDHVPTQRFASGAVGPGTGYGISVLKGDRATWLSGGSINGFNASLTYHPEAKTLVVVLSNQSSTTGSSGVTNGLLAILAGRKYHVPVKRTAVPFASADLEALAGVWEAQGSYAIVAGQRQPATLTVRVDGTRVFIRSTGGQEYEWYAEGPGRFFARHADQQIILKAESRLEASYLLSGRAAVIRKQAR